MARSAYQLLSGPPGFGPAGTPALLVQAEWGRPACRISGGGSACVASRDLRTNRSPDHRGLGRQGRRPYLFGLSGAASLPDQRSPHKLIAADRPHSTNTRPMFRTKKTAPEQERLFHMH
ncbi:hypothetical protein NCCP691_19830 [Noviherbaspirillum aridicola]|uniref:Uncharacterized protein n=1 Tax=Noviherbaspirillum aridicola TaxID=2849687 RepID=A0ABQ4Q4D4_9BURK|nr:hypothetical protein NCCP691_19830 [Noviherbaspirillum aridicola]